MRLPGPAADRERVLLLECRLEQMRAGLGAARTEADRARLKLAEASAREAEHARRFSLIHEELAEARAEIGALHRHLERSEALRAEIAGHLFEGGSRDDAEELVRLRQKVLADDQRALVSDRTVARLRARVEELVASRETLLTRIAEWQQLIREDGPEAADLSEFLAELRRDILELEHRSVTSDAREAMLRDRLARAGIDPDREADEPTDDAMADAVAADAQAADVEAADVEAAEVEAAEGDGIGAELIDPEELSSEARSGATAPSDTMLQPGHAAVTPLAEDTALAAELPLAEEMPPVPELPDAEETPLAAEPPAGPPADRGSASVELDTSHVAPPPAPEPVRLDGRTEALIAELEHADSPALQAALLLRLGRSGDEAAADILRPWTGSRDPSVRAAAYEALGRLLERAPDSLKPHLREGLADADARVRRRVVLAAATARGISPLDLLDPLREDPDPQVRRVVREVLRQARERGPRSLRPDQRQEASAQPGTSSGGGSSRPEAAPETVGQASAQNRSGGS